MATRKQTKKWYENPAVIIGGLVLVGGGIYLATRPRQEETAPQYLPAPADTPQPQPQPQPTPAPQPAPLTNFELLKEYFKRIAGIPFTEYTDRIEFYLTLNSIPRKIQFYSNGRFFFYWKDSAGVWKVSTKGNYTNGGKVLTITDGVKAGQIKNGSDVLMNIKNAII